MNNGGNGIVMSGLWLTDSKFSNEKYLCGSVGTIRFSVSKNKKKSKDSDPDYFLILTQKKYNGNNDSEDSSENKDNMPF